MLYQMESKIVLINSKKFERERERENLQEVVRWCRRMRVSSLASSLPGQACTPFPNGMYVLGLGGTCSITQTKTKARISIKSSLSPKKTIYSIFFTIQQDLIQTSKLVYVTNFLLPYKTSSRDLKHEKISGTDGLSRGRFIWK